MIMTNEVVGTAIHCPICKRFLVEAGEGTNIGINCEKCRKKYVIEIKGGMLHFSQVLTEQEGNSYPYVYVSTPKKHHGMQAKSKTRMAM